ncbi:MAG: methyl-accepting chemotaxis protein [Nitrospirota bacterium]
MKWFVDLSTRSKLIIGFGILIALMMIVIFVANRGIAVIQKSQKQLFSEELANTADLTLLKARQSDIRMALLTMVSMPDRASKEYWHQYIRKTADEINGINQRLFDRNKNEPRMMLRLEELNTVRVAFKQTRDTELIPLIYAGKDKEAKRLALGIQAERFDKMDSIAMTLVREAEENGVGSGDLAVNSLFTDRHDEVGKLAHVFNTMVKKLIEEMREVTEAVNVLASTSTQIAATVSQLAAGTEQTAVAVSETTTTVEEIKQTANVSAQKARHVSDLAQNTLQVSQRGSSLVNETMDGIGRIQEQMEYIAETIVKLSDHNQAIGEIIAAVDDISEQSNLLAVNASIEATKAGEYGKGFVVVAQEIKNLAEQSKQATKQVRMILNDIQKASSAAVMATEKGSKAVEATVKQSIGTGDSIQELSRSIAEASQAVMQIAASSQQELVGLDQVGLAMASIKQATSQNSASTKQVEMTVKNLQDLGQKLKALIEHYRL